MSADSASAAIELSNTAPVVDDRARRITRVSISESRREHVLAWAACLGPRSRHPRQASLAVDLGFPARPSSVGSHWSRRGKGHEYICQVYLVEKDMLATDGPLAD
jgi:hypothetical protein